jgi:MOSC domain-containing protein YiiM
MPGFVERIYVARGAGAPVERVEEVAAIEGCGLAGDRYSEGTGHWSRFGRVCQVTLIAAEDLDAIENETAIRARDGEHRRNVVLRGINLGSGTCAGGGSGLAGRPTSTQGRARSAGT